MKLIILYCLIFVIAILIKIVKYLKIKYSQVMINTIWFSSDGTLPENALNNLLQLSENINNSSYKNYYKIFLWTDKKKLIPSIKKLLKEKNIVIKEYRNVSQSDEDDKKAIRWVKDFVAAGNDENKPLFAMASDIFRIYLLLKEFPRKYPHAIICYMDCADVELVSVPNPIKLKDIKTIALSFTPNGFPSILTKNMLNNDIIITINKNNQEFFNEIFKDYCNNLRYVDARVNGILDMYFKTCDSMGVIDEFTLYNLIFGTTHIIFTLLQYGEELEDIYLLKRSDKIVTVKPMKSIKNVINYINVKRIEGAGLSWMLESSFEKNHRFPIINKYRDLWHDLFSSNISLANKYIKMSKEFSN